MGAFFPEPGSEGLGRKDQEDGESDSGGSGGDGEGDQEDDLRESSISNYRTCYELAGVIGVNPRPFTLRKLLWMAEAKERSEWNRAASLMVKIHNAHIAKQSDAIGFKDVHPYFIAEKIKEQRNREPTEGELTMLRNAIEGQSGNLSGSN